MSGTERTRPNGERRSRDTRPRERDSNRPQKGNSFFGGMAILTMGIMVVKLIGMFYKIPLGNIIGDQGNADFQNAYNIYAVLLTISTAGLPVAMSKLISEATTLKNEEEVRRIFTVSLKFFCFMGGISFIVMFFFSNQLAEIIGDSMAAPGIRALAPAVIFVSGISAFRGYFQGRGQMTPTALSQIIEALCKLILGLSLASAIMNTQYTEEHLEKYHPEWDISSYSEAELQAALDSTQASQAAAGAITGVTVGTALALLFLLGCYFLGGMPRRSRKPEQKISTQGQVIGKLLSIAIPITLTSSMASILNVLDAGLVQWQLQESLAMTEQESRVIYGNYGWALNIYNLPITLVTAVTISVIPAVTAALANRERRKAATIATSALRITALLALPMGMGLFALGKPIIALLYPSADVQMAGQLLSSLGLVASLVCLSLVCTSILQVYGFFYLPIGITVVGGVIKVLSNFVLVGQESIGIYGAPIGHLFCFGFCFVASYSMLLRIVPGLNRSYAHFYKPLIASTLMAGTAWAVHGFMSTLLISSFAGEIEGTLSGTGNAICTIFAIALAALVYLVMILTLGGIVKEDVLMMPKGEKLVKLLRL